MTSNSILPGDPLWYKDAVIYELHVRAFRDSTGDGIGDFGGLIEKLDYLADLGITALWLLPFYPSPLRDGGYDISDYVNIHPDYGSKREFKRFLSEAHSRGIRVLTELVINHTSIDHEWFQRARRAPAGSSERNYYVWTDDPKLYEDARIIFQDYERSNWEWDPVAKAYYWHRFFSHQPDLNFDNPEVAKAILRVLDYWMELGVDGVRLDAVPYLYEREGTSCENLPETHAFLKTLRSHVDSRYKNRMLLAEANQWPVDAAAYFGSGDECHMNFHFPLMPRLFMAIQTEDAFPIVDILRQTPIIPESCQWATFLRNHDELTLEMVTEEDRDYMYRVYARDERARVNLGIRHRLFPLLRERRRVELMNGLLFALPGTPVVYYGDEIGMGDNIYLGDRDAMRTPMQWNSDRNAGFSSANPQKLYLPVVVDPEYHFAAVNVDAQQTNPSSLLWWMKRVIALRKQHKSLSRGRIQFVEHRNPKVLAFVRSHESETILFVANLSRFGQSTDLELKQYRGLTPIEMFGRTPFPAIEEAPYRLMLGPHDQFWFLLSPAQSESTAMRSPIVAHHTWAAVFEPPVRVELATRLTRFACAQRWFRSKGQHVKSSSIEDVFHFDASSGPVVLVLLSVELSDSPCELYALPLCYVVGDVSSAIAERSPNALVTRVVVKDLDDRSTIEQGALFDGAVNTWFGEALLSVMRHNRPVAGEVGKLEPQVLSRSQTKWQDADLTPHCPGLEQSNSTIVYGHSLLTKLIRHLEAGPNIELEVAPAFLKAATRRRFPQFVFAVHYRLRGESSTLALTSEYIENRGTAWDLAVESTDVFLERALTSEVTNKVSASLVRPTVSGAAPSLSLIEHLATPFFSYLRTIAERTAQMHRALASERRLSSFAPEPFGVQYQQSLYQSARTQFMRVAEMLRRTMHSFDTRTREITKEIFLCAESVEQQLQVITSRKFDTMRIRCHGDFHLGQLLFTGDDFAIIDFEGEPSRPLGERRFKRCPLRDVAGMTRSIDYAIITALRSGRFRQDDLPKLSGWASSLRECATKAFLRWYSEYLADPTLVPQSEADLLQLHQFFELEKCLYEIGYELSNRPDWVEIPLMGLARIIGLEYATDGVG